MDLHPRSKPGGARHDGDGSVAERREAGTLNETSLAKMPLVSQHYENSNIGDQARVHFGNQYGDQHHHYYATKVEDRGKSISQGDLMKQFLESLSFPQMNYRFRTIKPPTPETCSWLVETPQYMQWRNLELRHMHHGLLWLRGKPGSGKSTIMKFVLEYAKATYPNERSLYFFFNGRGTDLEKSVEGMFRSLLHQIARYAPQLETAVPLEALEMYSKGGWPLELLNSLFYEAIHRCGEDHQITCYVDALDEGDDENQIREMVDFFEDTIEAAFAGNIRLLLCLASRHYPNISVRRSIGITLDGNEYHDQDIAQFVQSKLTCKQKALRKELIIETTERASGIFLWVVLTVRVLNKECDRGNQHSLKSRLRDVPKDINDLFKSIIREGATDECLLPALQWVLYANRSLRPEELYFAVLTATNSLSALSAVWNRESIDDTMLHNFITSSSKGLLEIVHEPEDQVNSVQFIHESAREFLISIGIQQLDPTLHDHMTRNHSMLLAQWCQTHLELIIESDRGRGLEAAMANKAHNLFDRHRLADSFTNMFPFLRYALDEGLRHSEMAARLGTIVPMRFEKTIQSALWLISNRIMVPPGSTPPILHILAHEGCPTLIEQILKTYLAHELGDYINEPFLNSDSEGAMRGTALHIAVARNLPDVVNLLLDADAQANVSYPGVSHPLHIAVSHRWWQTERDRILIIKRLLSHGADVESKHNGGRPVLHAAVHAGLDVLQILIGSGADIHATDDHGNSILHTAIECDDSHVAKACIEFGADVNASNEKGEHVLHTALRSGSSYNVIRMLLESGAATDAKDAVGDTALHVAVQTQRISAVRLCMSHGADINGRNNYGDTTFHHAIRNEGETAILEFVLAHGGDVNGCNNKGESPLHEAARNGHVKIVQLLVLQGANLENRDRGNMTPLCLAAMEGHVGVVKVLLLHGAQYENERAIKEGVDRLSATDANQAEIAKLLSHFSGVSAHARAKAIEKLERELWWHSYIAEVEERSDWAFDDSPLSTPERGVGTLDRVKQWCQDLERPFTSSQVED